MLAGISEIEKRVLSLGGKEFKFICASHRWSYTGKVKVPHTESIQIYKNTKYIQFVPESMNTHTHSLQSSGWEVGQRP